MAAIHTPIAVKSARQGRWCPASFAVTVVRSGTACEVSKPGFSTNRPENLVNPRPQPRADEFFGLVSQPPARQEVNGGSDYRQGDSTAAAAGARCARAARAGPCARRALGYHRGIPEPPARHRDGLQGRPEGLPDRLDHLDHGRQLRARPRRQAGARLRAHLGRLARRLARLPSHQVRGSALRHGHLAAGRRDQRRRVGGWSASGPRTSRAATTR